MPRELEGYRPQLELLTERSRKQETTNEDLAKLTEQMVCIVSLLESEP